MVEGTVVEPAELGGPAGLSETGDRACTKLKRSFVAKYTVIAP
jgi:hypothetical protein